jgi:hypothetical protein
MKIHISYLITFFRKSRRLWDNVEKYGGDRGATKDVKTWRIHFVCWISKVTCTHAHAHADAPEYPHASTHVHSCKQTNRQYLLFFHSNNGSRTRLVVTLYTYIGCLITIWIVNVTSVVINKQLVSSENCFVLLSRLCQWNVWRTFFHSKCLRGQNAVREPRVELAWARLWSWTAYELWILRNCDGGECFDLRAKTM